jgi:hypothetical protein
MQRRAAHLPHGDQELETDRQTEEEARQDIPFKVTLSGDLLPSIRPHLLLVLSALNSSMDPSIDDITVALIQSLNSTTIWDQAFNT